jgi:hypothetical protein
MEDFEKIWEKIKSKLQMTLEEMSLPKRFWESQRF